MSPSPRNSRSLLLEEAATIRSGFAPRRLDADPFGSHRGLQVRDLSGLGEVQWSRLMTPRVDSDAARYEVHDGDLVVSLRGSSVRAWRVSHPPERTIVVGQLAIVCARTGIAHPDYLLWYLNHTATTARFQALAKGTNLSFVPMSEFRRFSIALPALDVQHAIGRISELARSERRLLHELGALRQQLTDARLLRVAEMR